MKRTPPTPARTAADPRRRTAVRRSLVAALLLPTLVGGVALQAYSGQRGEQLFREVVARIAGQGIDSLSDAQVYEKAARGLLVQIGDPYAALFSPEQLEEFSRDALRNSYGGLGMQITTVRDTALVTRVFAGSPAQRAGVKAGDRIVTAAGNSVVGLPVEQVTGRLLGQPGTAIAVDFIRPGEGRIHQEFTRQRIRYPSVAYHTMVAPGIGYLPLESFNDTSGEEVAEAIVSLRKSGARAFVLDLRGNGGGSLQQAVRISNLFLRPGQEILRVDFRGAPDEVIQAENPPLLTDEPVVVLTDGGSASASEIVAGALQDHDRAVVIGTTSFGKGLVQDVFQLDGGWALKLTTGRWYTPSGRTIQRPRKLNEQGRLIEIDADSAGITRPEFRSDGGRVVFGGGGITPDVSVDPDSLAGADRALAVALGGNGARFNDALQELMVDRGPGLPRDFRSTPALRAELLSRLQTKGVRVDRAAWDAGSALIDRLIESRISGYVFGEDAAFLRGVGRDAQLQSALTVLRGARTQAEALARVPVRPVVAPAAAAPAAAGV
ncbi:S41 family peptidase [Longimicrobium terrae]|uniref:Carboxyl-terminal processing protease n=1 Tax=Longimicrobium terrae TaxID=1639882 RepID=A0A841GWN8_9BACT|nr:S41 family peptidase [Longimicrobium terrae]MBB4635251.1 carboxyl-terminal processing protease [Longimicrobium terrae]MBB6069645.1 carboxyl-terminal processing protease [Longimicrobium terrae]NNC31144.1 S41 family peptidase [Longimicrobium terrae]